MISRLRRTRRSTAALLGTAALAVATGAAALAGCSPAIDTEAAAAVQPVRSKQQVDDSATPEPVPTSASATAQIVASRTPVPATRTSYARNIPAYPPDGKHGRRIVYSKALMHVWIVSSHDVVVRSYAVTGRPDRPTKGTYRIYSTSTESQNAHSKAMFRWMVRFAWGTADTSASIGFHSIPVFYEDNPARQGKKGDRMSSLADLGLPVATGGCVRQADADARFLYGWAHVGDNVVVLPTA